MTRSRMVTLLSAISLLFLAAIYYSPVWWVSLKAPNYPAEAFPDGVRIHFHMNGVFNGCKLAAKRDVYEEKALDCVHEMDAINHFVGMFPIASGGVVEKFYSPFLMSFVGILIVGFMIPRPRLRVGVMAVGFAAVAVWMSLAYFSAGGLQYQSAGYLDAMVTSLGQGQEEEGEEQSSIIATLKKSLIDSGAGVAVSDRAELRKSVEKAGESKLGDALARLHDGQGNASAGGAKNLKDILAEVGRGPLKGKPLDLEILKRAYEADQARGAQGTSAQWKGSGRQALAWHYEKSLGRWFNIPERNGPMAKRMAAVADGLFWVILAAMAVMLGIGLSRGQLHLVLALVPVLFPVFFIIEYAGWLWWYGHSLNEMGAFTLKPFMPTVFGQGKVAQFSTHSYPQVGFFLMLAMSAAMTIALLIRRKDIAAHGEPGLASRR